MMRWIIGSSMQLRFLIVILAAILMGFGVAQLREMPVDVFPEFNPPLVEVQTEALGLSAAEVESLITVPMEADLLNGVAWLDEIYSESVAGMSSIVMRFEPGTDPIAARQMVQERLTQAHALPNVSKPPVMLQPLSATSRVMMVGISSQDLSLIDLGVLARWTIKPRLMGVPGVANVSIWGQRERQLQVQVDPARLREQGVTLQHIIETTGEALWVSPLSYLESSTPGTAGWIDTPNQRLGIRHLLPISSPEDLAKISVVDSKGLLLGDVANVVEDHQPLIGDAMVNDRPGLLLVIEKFPGANTLEVTREVEETLEAMRPGLNGVEIDTSVFRLANYIELATSNLATALLVSALLVVLVLGAFFFGWRTAVISLVAIPLSLVAAGMVLYLRGATFNTMILAGLVIALGVIIDDAIIDVENIARRLRQHRQEGGERSAAAIIMEASLELRSANLFALLILLLVAVPVFFIGGLSESFFQPLVVSYMLALLASLLVALVVTPALSMLLLSDGALDRRDSPLARWLRRGYDGLLARVMAAPRRARLVVAVLVIAALVVVPFLGQALVPAFKQTDLLIRWDGAPGTSRPAMERTIAQASRELRALPGVRDVGSHVGRAVTGDRVVGINSGEIWVSIDPAADYNATVDAVQQTVAGYPGLFRTVQTYQPARINEALAPAADDIVVRVYGHDLTVLRAKAEEVQQLLTGVTGVVEAKTDLRAEEPQVEIEVSLAAAERYGIKPGDVRRQATTLLSGLQVGNLFEDQKVFDVIVWGVPELRSNLSAIKDLLIDGPDGTYLRLGDVADVRVVSAPTVIRRDAVSRFVDVGATVSGRSLVAVAAEVKDRLRGVEFPPEFHAEVRGASPARLAAQQRLVAILVMVVIGIFLLLQAAFMSWRLAALAFGTMLAALSGGVLGAVVGGGVLSLGSLFGFFAVLGIATRNSMLLIKHYQHLQQHEGEALDDDLARRGAQERLTPILMTTLATGLALLPIIVLGPIPGLEILHPMALVVLGGLLTSLLITLFIVPTLYVRFAASPAPAPARPQLAPIGGGAD